VSGIEIGERIECPSRAVEITGQQTARVTKEQRVDPDVDLAGQMAPQDLIGKWQVVTVGGFPFGPAASNGGAPSGSSCSSAAPRQSVDVISSDEERSIESDLLLGTRPLIDTDWLLRSHDFKGEQRLLRRSGRWATRPFVETKEITQSGILGPESL
jgi:hypothetical protein